MPTLQEETDTMPLGKSGGGTPSYEYALARIRDVATSGDHESAKNLAQGLLLSVSFDVNNEVPSPPTVSQVFAACKPAAKDRVLDDGIVMDTRGAHTWLITQPGAPDVKFDTFRQWFRAKGRYFSTFGCEAHRHSDRRVLLTYAQCLHLAGMGDIFLKDRDSLRKEFKLSPKPR